MDTEIEFPHAEWTIPRVQAEFFLGTSPHEEFNLLWPSHPGRYRFREQGLAEENAPPGSLVLFQFANRIVASAVLVWIQRFAEPQAGVYSGAFWFEPESVRIFRPVCVEDVRRAWPDAIPTGSFSLVKHDLNPPAAYLRFCRRLSGVSAPVLTCPMPTEPLDVTASDSAL
jgi:hypothetical protein